MLTNSWVVVSKATSKAVLETWSKKIVELVNREKYTVMTAFEYLVWLNKRIKADEQWTTEGLS